MKKQTVLVVDDAPENIDVLHGILNERYAIKAATSGEVAMKIVKSEEPPDIILLDIVMPGMSGYDVRDAVKGDMATAHIPIVYVTGNEMTRNGEIPPGVEGFLRKPVEPGELLSLVERLLRTRT